MKALLHSLLIVLFMSTPSYAVDEVAELRQHAEKLIDEEYQNFNDSTLSADQKKANTREFIAKNLDLEWMAHYSLGRNRKTISKQKLNEFIRVYSKFVIKTYTELSTSYSGEKAVLKKIKQIDDDRFIANMEIVKPNGQPPIRVDYLVNETTDPNNRFLIGDIITEGISILNSQQAEFNSVISSHGIDALIADLKNRTESHK